MTEDLTEEERLLRHYLAAAQQAVERLQARYKHPVLAQVHGHLAQAAFGMGQFRGEQEKQRHD